VPKAVQQETRVTRAAKACLAKKEITVEEESKDLLDRSVKKEDWVLKATLDLLVPMER